MPADPQLGEALHALAGAWAAGPAERAAWFPLVIFALRSVDLTLGTLRVLTVVRGRRLAAWAIGFCQALLFISAIAGVLDDLANPWNLAAYAAGFATGNVLGIALEAIFAPGHSLLRVVSPRRGEAVAARLRQAGWGATEMTARGAEGTVGMILCYVPRRALGAARQEVLAADPEAFLSAGPVRALRGGWRA